MYFIFLSLSIVAATAVPCCGSEGSSEVYIYDLDDAEYHFVNFIDKFDKKYSSEEAEYRLEVFKENLIKINDLNRENKLNLHGITQFSDMTEEEFVDYSNCLKSESLNMTDVNVINLGNVPDVTYPPELDYRNQGWVSYVKDQGHCGSCYIFSAVENIEGQYAKAHGQLYSLSEQEALDCASEEGCIGGHPYYVMQSLASFGGLVAEENYPYCHIQKACTVNRNQIIVRVQGSTMIQGGEAGLIQALNMYGPLAIGINVIPSLQTWFTGNIFNDPRCTTQPTGKHAVLLIGYGTNEQGPFWLIKNSWGVTWGEGGYFRLARGVGMCNIGSDVATATVF